MRRTLRLSATVFAAALVAAGSAGAQGFAPGLPGGVGPRHSAPAVAPEGEGAAPGIMPGPMYSEGGQLQPQQRQSPDVSSALRDLYSDPMKQYYRNASPPGGGGNELDPSTRRALRQLYGGSVPLTGPSLPEGPPGAQSRNATPDASARAFPRYDLNGDGVISADEYSAVHMRAAPADPTAADAARRRTLMERFSSRFRAADRNGDGRVTPDELNADPNARF